MPWLARTCLAATLSLVACSRSPPSIHSRPAYDASAGDVCTGEVRGEPVLGLEPNDLRFRLIVEGQPVFPICNSCGVTMVVDPPGPEVPVLAHQDEKTGTIFGLLAKEPPEGACVRVSPVLGDSHGRPVGRYRHRPDR